MFSGLESLIIAVFMLVPGIIIFIFVFIKVFDWVTQKQTVIDARWQTKLRILLISISLALAITLGLLALFFKVFV